MIMNIHLNITALNSRISQAAKNTSAATARVFAKIAYVVKEVFKRIAFFFQSIPQNQRTQFHAISQNELNENLLPACITAATCKQDDASWTTPFNAISVDLSAFAGALPDGFIYLDDKNTIVHKQCAIVIKVYETDSKRFICFGAKSAIMHTGLPDVAGSAKNILKMGIKGALGINAPFVDPAIAIAEFFQNQTPLFQDGKSTQYVGHSYGATLSEIAATHTGKQAICFAPFHLGVDIQYKLGKTKLANATNNIKIIFVENDWLTCKGIKWLQKIAGFFQVRFPNNFGDHAMMPSAYKTSQESHDYLLGSYMKALGHGIRTKPSELDPAIIAQFR
jgi:hypothetical protein